MTGNDTACSTYSRREFIAASGKGIAGTAIASLLAAGMTGCSSKAAASDSGLWETVRLNGAVRLSPHYYVSESELSRIIGAVYQIAGIG